MTILGDSPLLTLYKAYPQAPDIRYAERGAAGTMPASAFQYCEAMRTVSAFGWYVYPPKDISLYFDGIETFIFEEGEWIPLKSYTFEDEFRAKWRTVAPENLRDRDPPYISDLPFPGYVQIWSGYFAETQPNWSLHVRAPVNNSERSSFQHFEGVIETDKWKPAPIFGNIRILKTGVEVYIDHQRPFLQIVPIYRAMDMVKPVDYTEIDLLSDEGAKRFDWNGLENTTRHAKKDVNYRPGRYATTVRAKQKRD